MNIQVPDNTPIMQIIKFATELGLAVRYVRNGDIACEQHIMQPKPEPAKVVSLDSRRV